MHTGTSLSVLASKGGTRLEFAPTSSMNNSRPLVGPVHRDERSNSHSVSTIMSFEILEAQHGLARALSICMLRTRLGG